MPWLWLSAWRENSFFATGPVVITEYTRALFVSVRPSVCLQPFLSLSPFWVFGTIPCSVLPTLGYICTILYVMAGSSTLQTSGQTPSVWADMENNKHNGDIHCTQTHERNLPSHWFVVLSEQKQNIRVLRSLWAHIDSPWKLMWYHIWYACVF